MKRIVVALLVCSTALTLRAQDAPSASDAFYTAIRENDIAKLQTMLKSGADPNTPDARGGATPLMNAAAVGSIEAMKLLLDHGADVNAKNSTRATALMWAVTEIDKVRLLLSRGADAKAVSERGRTALTLAARSEQSAPIVRLLMAAGADAKSVDAFKMTALVAAAYGNDTETIRLLVEAGNDVNAADFAGFTPLIHAAFNNNLEVARLLLAKGANVNAMSSDGAFQKVKNGSIALGNWTPLSAAAAAGSPSLVKLFLDAGANVNAPDVRGMTALMLAISTDRQNAEVIQLLLARGADVAATSKAGETALDWAVKIGSPGAIQMIRRAGGRETMREAVVVPAAAHTDLRGSVERGLSLLNRMSTQAAANGGCASCHSHNIVDIAQHVARLKGFGPDEKALSQRQTLTKAPFFSPANLFERMDPPAADIISYALVALAAGEHKPDRVTDAMVVNFIANQRADGRWSMGGIARPPIEDGDFRTALGIAALAMYGPPGRSAEIKARIARARTWLEKAKPVTAEDRNMQLLGLCFAEVPVARRAGIVKSILAKQRPDGGWSQTDHLASDAYATGQSLFALAHAGEVDIKNPAFQKGVQYLLSTQRGDGSWYVRSRSPKFQPFFDGGFPYQHDQWISSMATGWATAALALALP